MINLKKPKTITFEKKRNDRESSSSWEKGIRILRKMKDIQPQKENVQQGSTLELGFQKFKAQNVDPHDKHKLPEDAGWIQYKPWEKSEKKKQKISLNTATIHGIAKRLIAREWSQVLRKTLNHRANSFERKAASLKNRFEREKRVKK